jgi:group I intron endonuclease
MARRRYQHITYLRKGNHKNKHLQNAWNLYGESAFVFGELQVVDLEDDLLRAEQFWIDTLNVCDKVCGYNNSPVAGRTTGMVWSEESKARLSEAKMGITHTEEGKKNISAGMIEFYKNNPDMIEQKRQQSTGRKHKQSAKEKVSKSKLGKKRSEFSEEWRKNMSESHKGKKYSEETKKKMSEAKKLYWENKKAQKLKEAQQCDTPKLEAA